ncbi:SPOC like C-terminal domain [Pseudocohnilembus persalinus]|uniref:SPOC like C-terminal domain n=1 Tax=Pseudocohnilembus persalinus TaxID=266149 RepID=A0A0V0R690_PSEPJ|nr:SPOC like C-terminal domain [Pseudocohnilembus persalinus]|eukprot:KRX10022.1 SPOC like C-terminal domain [Pseudocohnilembus persalinus]
MSNKEAIFLLIDVGASMHEKLEQIKNDDNITRLDFAVDCIIEFIQQKLFLTTQAHIGVILFGSDEAEDGNALYVQEIIKPDAQLVRNIMEIKQHDVPSKKGGDIFDAIDKTIQTIDDFVKTKKFTKNIFVFTNGGGDTNYTEVRLRALNKSLEKSQCKINITAIDFANKYEPGCDIEDINFERDENQNDQQNMNQEMLLMIKEKLPNQIEIYPTNIAQKLYTQFRTKQSTDRVSFRGVFEITQYIKIEIELYKKCTETKLKSLKRYSKQAQFNTSVESGTITKDTIQFEYDDPNMEPIEQENVIKGYYYGRQLVPITQAFEEEMQYKAEKGLKLLGFTDQANVPRQQFMGDVSCLIAVGKAEYQKCLASLIKACFQLKKCVIIRYVYNSRSAPRLCVLFPHIASNYECFYMTELPTTESIRDYQFNSLKEPTQEQEKVVSDLIDKMDLDDIRSDSEKEENDDEEDKIEGLKPKFTYNPYIQYFYQTIMHRLFTQNEDGTQSAEIPPLNPRINSYLRPENKMYEKAAKEIEAVQQVFAFEERQEEQDKEKKVYWRDLISNMENQEEEEKQLEGLNEAQREQLADLKKGKFIFDDEKDVENVSDLHPIEDFRKMVENKKVDLVVKAVEQMQKVITNLVNQSFQGSWYRKALACLKELRKTCINQEEVQQFNDFLKVLKNEYGQKNHKHNKFWELVVTEGVTLILKSENLTSDVTFEEAIKFNRSNQDQLQQNIKSQNEQNGNSQLDLEDEIE